MNSSYVTASAFYSDSLKLIKKIFLEGQSPTSKEEISYIGISIFPKTCLIYFIFTPILCVLGNLTFWSFKTWLNLLIIYLEVPQSAFTCSKLTIERLEQGVKYIQS